MYISSLYSINDTPIWMNPLWYLKNPAPIVGANYVDVFGLKILPPNDFALERKTIFDSDLKELRGQIAYNMLCGKMMVALFREDVFLSGLTRQGVDLLKQFQLVELALLAGAVAEASEILTEMSVDAWWTAERSLRYISMLSSCNSIGIQNV